MSEITEKAQATLEKWYSLDFERLETYEHRADTFGYYAERLADDLEAVLREIKGDV